MNILVFSWRDPKHPNRGGAEQVMHEHMKGWLKAGHKVTLFASRFSGSASEEVLDGVRVVRRGCQYLGVQVEGFKYYWMHKKEIDLVIDQFHGIPFFTPLYVKQPVLAVLQEVAGKVWLKNDLPWPMNWLIGTIGYITEPLVFLLYKKIPFMVGSNSAREDLIKIGILNKHITIVPHGVILPKKIPPYHKEKVKTILFFGAVSKDKGIGDALEVFSLLNIRGKYQFWIAGRVSEYYRQFIKQRAEELKISANLKTWLGFVSDEKKFELMKKAHVLINPSVKEGWGLVNIEANAMGTPVVAYRLPGLVDSVNQEVSGLLSELMSPEGLVKSIERVLIGTKEYGVWCVGAIKWSQNFTWDKSKKLSLELIENVKISYK